MGLVHDLGLIGDSGDIESITETVIETDAYTANCESLFGNSKSSTVYVLARVDLMNNRLFASADGKIVGPFLPKDERVTAAIVSKSPEPTIAMGELFQSQFGWAMRLHFHPSIVD